MGAKQQSGWSGRALNAALVVAGLGVAVLLYSFVTGSVLPGGVFEGGDGGGDPRPARAEEAPGSEGGATGEIVQVGVRNGSGAPGIAAETTRYLRAEGFDVVEAGNHSSFDEPRSYVVDRVGDLDAARRVAAALGLPKGRVRQEVRPEYYLDASVVLGRDYATLRPFQEEDDS